MNHIVEDEKRYKNDLGRENRSAIRCSISMALLALAAIAAGALVAFAQKPPSGNTVAYAAAAAPDPRIAAAPRPCPGKSCSPAKGSRPTSLEE